MRTALAEKEEQLQRQQCVITDLEATINAQSCDIRTALQLVSTQCHMSRHAGFLAVVGVYFNLPVAWVLAQEGCPNSVHYEMATQYSSTVTATGVCTTTSRLCAYVRRLHTSMTSQAFGKHRWMIWSLCNIPRAAIAIQYCSSNQLHTTMTAHIVPGQRLTQHSITLLPVIFAAVRVGHSISIPTAWMCYAKTCSSWMHRLQTLIPTLHQLVIDCITDAKHVRMQST